MTRLLLEQDGVVISTDTPVITYNPDPIDEYIVIVNDASDWQEIHDYIINEKSFNELPMLVKKAFSIRKNYGQKYLSEAVKILKNKGYEFITMTELYNEIKNS